MEQEIRAQQEQRRRGIPLADANKTQEDRSTYDTEIDVSGREPSDEMEIDTSSRRQTRSSKSSSYNIAKEALRETADAAASSDNDVRAFVVVLLPANAECSAAI